MSISKVHQPGAGPMRELIRTAHDPRAQVKGLSVLILTTVERWMTRSRQRRALYEIAERTDDYLLKDIGISREEALREASKPFWRQ